MLSALQWFRFVGPWKMNWTLRGLEDALTSTNLLAFSDSESPFIMATDASTTVVCAFLFQKINSHIHRNQYASGTRNDAEWNYMACEREAILIIFALWRFRVYLLFSYFQSEYLPSGSSYAFSKSTFTENAPGGLNALQNTNLANISPSYPKWHGRFSLPPLCEGSPLRSGMDDRHITIATFPEGLDIDLPLLDVTHYLSGKPVLEEDPYCFTVSAFHRNFSSFRITGSFAASLWVFRSFSPARLKLKHSMTSIM